MDLNRDQCQTLGVNPQRRFQHACRSISARYYVNDFNRFGRTWQVVVQAEGDVPQRRRRRSSGSRCATPTATWSAGRRPDRPRRSAARCILTRYNMYPAAAIIGDTQARRQFRRGHRGHGAIWPTRTCRKAWATSGPRSITSRSTPAKNIWNNLIFPLAVVFVFLVLAALYESWALPLAVILVVPMCILSSLTGVAITHGDINIFTQIGFVVLVGLASKNAILIVEFAKHKRDDGPVAARRHAGGREAAAAADPDDLVRVHPWRGAADYRGRRRGGDAARRWAWPCSAACWA